MLKEDIAEPLQAIISSMYNLPNTSITLEEPNRGISVTINFKNYSYMNFTYTQRKEKGNISFKTDDFPVYAYHNSIARLAPIYDQLLFLGKHPEYANSNLMISFASTIGNISLMLSEETLIKTENSISDRIPIDQRQDKVIFCGPVGEYFVFTIHFVKVKGTPSSVSMTALNQNANNSILTDNNNNSGNSQNKEMQNSYSTPAVTQIGNVNTNSNNGPNINSNNTSNSPNASNSNNELNINLSSTSSSTVNLNSSTNNLSSQQKLPISRSNGNLSLMTSSSINSPSLEAASVSPSSLNYESPAFWRPFAQDTTFPHLGKEYVVTDSVMLRTKFKIQSVVLSQLKALQMLLSAISVNLSIQAEEEEIEEEDIDN